MIMCILFNHDGTLADSVPQCRTASNLALADAGLPAVSRQDIADGMRLETVLRMLRHANTEDPNLGRTLPLSFHRYLNP